MERARRSEIQKFADESFAVQRERIAAEYGEKRRRALIQVAHTGNSGGYLPALTTLEAECVRTMILAQSDAVTEAFTLYGIPSDTKSEMDLDTMGRRFAAGSISAIHGELQLLSQRTRQPMDTGVHLCHSEIERALNTSVKEGVVRLRRQRIAATRGEAPTAQVSFCNTDHVERPPCAETSDRIGKRTRGRPQTISDEKKKAALALKATGGTNKQLASLLYCTAYPSDRQRKCVPTILRQYQRKIHSQPQ